MVRMVIMESMLLFLWQWPTDQSQILHASGCIMPSRTQHRDEIMSVHGMPWFVVQLGTAVAVYIPYPYNIIALSFLSVAYVLIYSCVVRMVILESVLLFLWEWPAD